MKERIKFYLDKENSKGTSYIFLRYPCKDGYLRYSTKQSCKPVEWNDQMQMAVDRSVNMELNQIYVIMVQYLEHCRIMGKKEIYRKDLITELNSKLERKERTVRASNSHFFESLDKIITEAKEGKLLTPKGTKYTSGSIKNFQKCRDRLYEFSPSLEFNNITIQTYKDFLTHCNEQGYMANYTGTFIKDWKALMNIAYSKGWHKNLIQKDPQFKKIGEYSFQVYLNDEEIEKLYRHNLKAVPYLERIRDRFVINLFLGLRISDMKVITIKNIQDGVITQINKKTGKKVVVPVHPIVEEIMKKYDGNLPKQYHENVVNREIKEIAKAAGINKLEHYTRTIGGIKQAFISEKWEMISTHTCRRSLVSNLLKHADMQSVMPVMGMSLKTLQHYNKRSAEENAQIMKDNPYFKKRGQIGI